MKLIIFIFEYNRIHHKLFPIKGQDLFDSYVFSLLHFLQKFYNRVNNYIM